jgi:hypothetical protein
LFGLSLSITLGLEMVDRVASMLPSCPDKAKAVAINRCIGDHFVSMAILFTTGWSTV